jgi:hypothetical protein
MVNGKVLDPANPYMYVVCEIKQELFETYTQFSIVTHVRGDYSTHPRKIEGIARPRRVGVRGQTKCRNRQSP